uniref:Vesicle transport v-SNARE N-terminal domain-containing protein n=1 Tax=Hyaloperonospora arabidopsidis (strain Emoy2) TaxID=559515 RepID=M4B9Z5_HYAAE
MAATADFPAEFLSLEADFVDSKIAINNSIGDILRGRATTASNATPIVQAQVVEAQRYIKLMTVEVRGRPLQLKKAMQTKINLYREELQGLIRDVERAQLMAQKDKVASSSTGNHVRETGAMTIEARRVLQRMMRRIITNTIVLYTTIFALIAAICYVLYADFIRATRLF